MNAEILALREIYQRGEQAAYRPCAPPAAPVVVPAHAMLRHCEQALALSLRICWFSVHPMTATKGPLWGPPGYRDMLGGDPYAAQLNGRSSGAYPGIIFVNAMRSPYRTACIVAHEARHQWQIAVGGWDGRPGHTGPAERDARIYEASKRELARSLARKPAQSTRPRRKP